MQAVILAGGRGARLRPYTDVVPKPMIKVRGVPILERTLSLLPEAIEEVLIVIGYKGDVIQARFKDSFKNRSIRYINQPEQRGTADALLRTRQYLRDELFLFLSGDDLYHQADIAELSKKDTPTVLASHFKFPERFGVCLINERWHLVGMLEKQKNPPSDLVNTGAYLLAPDIFKISPPILPNGELNLAEQIGAWAKTRPVHVKEARVWHPINNLQELASAELATESGAFSL